MIYLSPAVACVGAIDVVRGVRCPSGRDVGLPQPSLIVDPGAAEAGQVDDRVR